MIDGHLELSTGQLSNQSLDLTGEAVLKVEYVATPNESLLKSPEVEASDDAEVVPAAS